MVEIGQKVKFDPYAEANGTCSRTLKGNLVTGTVMLVNKAHKWFSIEYFINGSKQRTSYKFCDIGEDVILCD